MSETDRMTPEALLNRAIGALNKAEEEAVGAPGTFAWADLARTAVEAGQLALDIRNTVPKTVVIEDLSGLGQALLDNVIEDSNIPEGQAVSGNPADLDPRVTEGRQVWVNPDEWETLLALRTGAATVHVTDSAARHGVRLAAEGTFEAPESHVDAPADAVGVSGRGMTDEARYRTIIVGLLLARSTVSEYVPGALIRQAPPWRLEIGENPADGAVTLRIDRS